MTKSGRWGSWVRAGAIVLFGASNAVGGGCSSGSGTTTMSDAGSGEGGGGGDGSSAAPNRLVGTVTLPADATGRCAMLVVDTDTTGANGSARRPDGSYLLEYKRVTGKTLELAFDAVPNGTYFLWAYVDTNGSASSATGDCEIDGAPDKGDFLGYWDTGLAPPGAPNVTVPAAAGARFDFTLGTFP